VVGRQFDVGQRGVRHVVESALDRGEAAGLELREQEARLDAAVELVAEVEHRRAVVELAGADVELLGEVERLVGEFERVPIETVHGRGLGAVR
jgi:hypothetical protein